MVSPPCSSLTVGKRSEGLQRTVYGDPHQLFPFVLSASDFVLNQLMMASGREETCEEEVPELATPTRTSQPDPDRALLFTPKKPVTPAATTAFGIKVTVGAGASVVVVVVVVGGGGEVVVVVGGGAVVLGGRVGVVVVDVVVLVVVVFLVVVVVFLVVDLKVVVVVVVRLEVAGLVVCGGPTTPEGLADVVLGFRVLVVDETGAREVVIRVQVRPTWVKPSSHPVLGMGTLFVSEVLRVRERGAT